MNTKIFLSIAIILFCFSCKSKTNQEVSNNSEQKTDMPVGFSVLRIPEDETPQEKATSQENETHKEKWSHLKINSYFKNAINKYRDQIDDIYEHLTDLDYNHDRSRTFYEHRHMSDSDRIKDLYDELLTLVEKCPEDLVIFNFEKGTVRGVNYDNIHNLINYPNEFFKGMDRLNYISGFPTDRTISGDFNGDGKTDSLMLGPPFEKVFEAIRLLIYSETDRSEIEKFYEESIGGVENVSRVEFVFSDKTIPMLNMSSYWGYLIKNEGDLDGDGGDEIGFIAGWPTSDCRSYEVLTLKNNKWYSLGISSSCDMRIAGIAPIEKDPEQKGVILFRQPMSTSCLRCLFVIEWSRKAKDLKKWLYEQVITSGD